MTEEGLPRCPHCGQVMDDIQAMDEPQLLEAIHLGVLRDLARVVRSGEATHQELAIARGILRDNSKRVATDQDDDDDDPDMPGATKRPLPEARTFPDYDHDE